MSKKPVYDIKAGECTFCYDLGLCAVYKGVEAPPLSDTLDGLRVGTAAICDGCAEEALEVGHIKWDGKKFVDTDSKDRSDKALAEAARLLFDNVRGPGDKDDSGSLPSRSPAECLVEATKRHAFVAGFAAATRQSDYADYEEYDVACENAFQEYFKNKR